MGKRHINKDLLWKIAHRIKAIREAHDVTQEVFYHDTGIHIGRIERADRDISISTLHRICEYFEMSLEEFFRGIS